MISWPREIGWRIFLVGPRLFHASSSSTLSSLKKLGLQAILLGLCALWATMKPTKLRLPLIYRLSERVEHKSWDTFIFNPSISTPFLFSEGSLILEKFPRFLPNQDLDFLGSYLNDGCRQNSVLILHRLLNLFIISNCVFNPFFRVRWWWVDFFVKKLKS